MHFGRSVDRSIAVLHVGRWPVSHVTAPHVFSPNLDEWERGLAGILVCRKRKIGMRGSNPFHFVPQFQGTPQSATPIVTSYPWRDSRKAMIFLKSLKRSEKSHDFLKSLRIFEKTMNFWNLWEYLRKVMNFWSPWEDLTKAMIFWSPLRS